jgi:hypothetical protein
MAQAGVDLATLAAILGHGSIRSVEKYVHPTAEHKQQAMLKFEESKLFECLVKEEHEVLLKAELSIEADSENDLGGSSWRICTTSDLTFTRRRSATA